MTAKQIEEQIKWLGTVEAVGDVRLKVIEKARDFLFHVVDKLPNVNPPIGMSNCPDGNYISFTWDNHVNHFHVQFEDDGCAEFFYRTRNPEWYTGKDFEPDEAVVLDEEYLNYLKSTHEDSVLS